MAKPLTEGKVSKGGQNPPLHPGSPRPPAPKGSGGHQHVYDIDHPNSCAICGDPRFGWTFAEQEKGPNE